MDDTLCDLSVCVSKSSSNVREEGEGRGEKSNVKKERVFGAKKENEIKEDDWNEMVNSMLNEKDKDD